MRIKWLVFASILLLSFSLAACGTSGTQPGSAPTGNNDTAPPSTDKASTDLSATTRTYKTAFGEIQIPVSVQRVVTLQYAAGRRENTTHFFICQKNKSGGWAQKRHFKGSGEAAAGEERKQEKRLQILGTLAWGRSCTASFQKRNPRPKQTVLWAVQSGR